MTGDVGRNSSSSSTAPNSAPSYTVSLSSSRSQHSRSSPSGASLPASSSATTRLPTSVAVRKSSTAWLHLSSAVSAKRSRIFHRSFHLPVSLRTSGYRIFCWAFHSGHTLKRCSRVWIGYRHHQRLRGGPNLRPIEVPPGETVSRLDLV